MLLCDSSQLIVCGRKFTKGMLDWPLMTPVNNVQVITKSKSMTLIFTTFLRFPCFQCPVVYWVKNQAKVDIAHSNYPDFKWMYSLVGGMHRCKFVRVVLPTNVWCFGAPPRSSWHAMMVDLEKHHTVAPLFWDLLVWCCVSHVSWCSVYNNKWSSIMCEYVA